MPDNSVTKDVIQYHIKDGIINRDHWFQISNKSYLHLLWLGSEQSTKQLFHNNLAGEERGYLC